MEQSPSPSISGVQINENNYEKNKKIQTAIRQKCLFTNSPQKTTNFNVAASPFILNNISATLKTSSANELRSLSSTRLSAPASYVPPIPHPILKGIDSRVWRSISARHVPQIYGFDEELQRMNSMTTIPQYQVPLSSRSNNCYVDTSRTCGPVALPNGTIQLRLRDGIRIDMTLDRSVRVTNFKSGIAIALASTANSAAIVHPNGKVYQYGSRVEIVAYDGNQTNNYVRYAKMWYKGISFTSDNCALIYLVDSAGTRTTTDGFTDMTKDYTISVFLNDSIHGPCYSEEALSIVQNSSFWYNDDGTEVYDINSFRISQTPDGQVRLTRSNNKFLLRTSPGNGSATLSTPFIHCTASLGQTSHLFVKRGERRMHFDGTQFVVRNAGHSAGFDENNLLKVY